MYISNQFPQIGIFLTDNGFIPILKEKSMTFVPVIEIDRVSGQQSSHQSGKRYRPSAKQKMSVIRHQNPCITCRFGLRQKDREALYKILVIFPVQEYLATFNPPDHDVV
jgi:hypothetical protein